MRIAFGAYRGTMASGGLGQYLYPLTRELAAIGHEVDLYVGPPYPDAMPWLREIRLPNERYWERKWSERGRAPVAGGPPLRVFRPLNFYELCVTRFGFLPEMFTFSARMARAVIRELGRGTHYDLVHDVQTLGYGLLLLRALGLPTVATVHHPLSVDLRWSLARDKSFADRKGSLTFHPVRMQSRVARRIDAVITSSQASLEEIATGFGVRRGRLHNLGNGVSLPAPGKPRARPARDELLFVGRCGDPNKGFEYLLSALYRLPDSVRLRVFDKCPQGSELHRQLKALGLEARVSFEGKRPRAEFEDALRSATLLVVPSLFEGFGLPAVEALACGTPVVATRAGALAEVMARAGCGTLVDAADAESLARGIGGVLNGWERQHRAALAARSRLEQLFGWQEVAQRTVEVYRLAVERAGARR